MIEIVDDIKFPEKYQTVIREEMNRVLSSKHLNHGLDIRVFEVTAKFMKIPHGGWSQPIECRLEEATLIAVKVKFIRIDRNRKEEYRTIDTKHAGFQIFLPKKIKTVREKIINEILDMTEPNGTL